MTTTVGVYVTRRDGGVAYYYCVTWTRHGLDISWVADVRGPDGGFDDTPHGTIQGFPGDDAAVTPLVRDLVEGNIEEHASVA